MRLSRLVTSHLLEEFVCAIYGKFAWLQPWSAAHGRALLRLRQRRLPHRPPKQPPCPPSRRQNPQQRLRRPCRCQGGHADLCLQGWLHHERGVLQGACSGRKGIDQQATAKAAAGAKPAATAAPGGGAGKVWANEDSKIYHCPGTRFYGTTKNGKYMSEADAKAAGMHGANNKSCS
jgi:hypothetical protein